MNNSTMSFILNSNIKSVLNVLADFTKKNNFTFTKLGSYGITNNVEPTINIKISHKLNFFEGFKFFRFGVMNDYAEIVVTVFDLYKYIQVYITILGTGVSINGKPAINKKASTHYADLLKEKLYEL